MELSVELKKEIQLNSTEIGERIYNLAEILFPICRSITGNGVRETLDTVSYIIPLTIHEIPTGTQVFDWEVPKEWNIRDAYIKDENGNKIIDFNVNNLHVVSYSKPVHKKLNLKELKSHLHTLPDKPDWIPYRTSYYEETWGFCLTHNQLLSLHDGVYEVFIDSSLSDGSLTYGEYKINGKTKKEVLISTHVCHPSLANDNLSGIGLSTYLANALSKKQPYYTYRFLFIPGTIGSISWLATNEAKIKNIAHGLVLSCVGDAGGPTYKKSRRGNAAIDYAMQHILTHSEYHEAIEDFSPYGYDERQFCSPGFNLPMGLFERSKYGQYPEYHTSADNLSLISPKSLSESYEMVMSCIEILENNRTYVNKKNKCEPQLGKRGLYKAIGGDNEAARKQLAMLWVLNQSDGHQSLLDISLKSEMPFALINEVALILTEFDLIAETREPEKV